MLGVLENDHRNLCKSSLGRNMQAVQYLSQVKNPSENSYQNRLGTVM
jgi:hypothetical protein